MERTSFNDGWQVREKPDMAAELRGGASPWAPVRLPHDAMITTLRHPGGTPAAGYFPGGPGSTRRASPSARNNADAASWWSSRASTEAQRCT